MTGPAVEGLEWTLPFTPARSRRRSATTPPEVPTLHAQLDRDAVDAATKVDCGNREGFVIGIIGAGAVYAAARASAFGPPRRRNTTSSTGVLIHVEIASALMQIEGASGYEFQHVTRRDPVLMSVRPRPSRSAAPTASGRVRSISALRTALSMARCRPGWRRRGGM